MRCTSPRTVGFHADGKTICWSPKNYSKEFATFQLPCGKCLSCRLESARLTAIRCVHEAQMHEKNCFITLTYSDENLKSNTLQYVDFQLFMKRLRKHTFTQFIKQFGKENWSLLEKHEQKEIYGKHQLGVFVAGEYGAKNKRPHFHALIFNWSPSDPEYSHTNDNGDKLQTSDELTKLWGLGKCDFGAITMQSAGYCARYATKKLVHGNDQDHEFHPISKRSSKNAIGKKWIEKYWPDVFNHGYLVLPDGQTSSIPRYYEKWLKKNHSLVWEKYVTKTKLLKLQEAQERTELQKLKEKETNLKRDSLKGHSVTEDVKRDKILKEKINKLQSFQKL